MAITENKNCNEKLLFGMGFAIVEEKNALRSTKTEDKNGVPVKVV